MNLAQSRSFTLHPYDFEKIGLVQQKLKMDYGIEATKSQVVCMMICAFQPHECDVLKIYRLIESTDLRKKKKKSGPRDREAVL